ncbi:unnamed protein product [Orchesella dallaii]|uniref:Uncharacterized protein n=1 Tax=Orchesella dallaii TaxID=48710 RepID=A0ABP1QXW0_9HEXA
MMEMIMKEKSRELPLKQTEEKQEAEIVYGPFQKVVWLTRSFTGHHHQSLLCNSYQHLEMGQFRKIWGMCSILTFLCSILQFASGAPDSLGIPIIKSLLQGSSEGLKDLVNSHSSKLLPQLTADGSANSPHDINSLISKFSPKQGRLDPVVVEMLSAFDRNYRDTGGSSTESQFPDEGSSNRVASSTEENGIIWQDTESRTTKRDRESSKFSSRYRSNKTEPTTNIFTRSHNDTNNVTDPSDSDSHMLPFDHITDPNIRNHRLYDWEFETYKNFTHIDQAEDLMADEDHATETRVSIVAAPPPTTMHPSPQMTNKNEEKNGESIIPSGWVTKPNGSKSKRVKVKGVPHIVISLEDTSEPGFDHRVHVPGSYLKLPMDSAERSAYRPREPLRQSSTENIVYVHGSAEEVPYPYSGRRDSTDHELDGRYADRSHKFRPSAADLSDAVFIDPDQDFFTSTVKSSDLRRQDDQEISSETLPKRRRKKLRKITKKEDIDDLSQSDRFSHRNSERHDLDDSDSYQSKHSDRPGISYSPEYSRSNLVGKNDENHGRAHVPVRNGYNAITRVPAPHGLIKPSKYLGTVENTRIKSDRILYPGGGDEYTMSQGQGQPVNYEPLDTPSHHHDGGIGNYYSLHSDPGLHSNLGSTGNDANSHPFAHQNHELTSTEYLGMGHRFQNALNSLNIFGHQQPGKKLQPSAADQVIAPGNIQDFYHPYAAEDHHVNQYYDDGYSSWSNTFFILAGLIAFTAVFALLLPTFITSGRIGKKHHRHDLDEEDLNTSTYAGSSSNNNNNYNYDNTTDDVGQNPDLWHEIKGAYNDLVNLFRGDYSLLSKFKKEPDGPKIVFRDDDQDESDDDDEEDDEKNDNSVPLRNRKRERYVKKQQQLLKQQQQQQKRQQQQKKQGQKATKKTLVSKTNIQAGRDNKDGKSGKTIDATSVNNLVVVSGPAAGPLSKTIQEEEHSSPRAVTGFIFPDNSTMATIPLFNTTAGALVSAADSFLNEWAQVQLINNH